MKILLLVVLFSCSTAMCRRVNGFDAESANCTSDEEFKYLEPCPGEVNCGSLNAAVACPAVVQHAVPQCVCKEGLHRGYDNRCYTKERCDELLCPGGNQFFECGDVCDNVCTMLDKQNRTNCPESVYTYLCLPQCYCNDGYARDYKQNCIPIENCDSLGDRVMSELLDNITR
ncbi:von Willebrand factor-like [Trichoplusia ni]|uniref:von Willebrand factor-like n=1 Tax=Trichoplusia ni TaxID=7111 RepID=A0A7E5VMH5_TRINI|nr:von Willebrand factor-like [Trichoplusia ni]